MNRGRNRQFNNNNWNVHWVMDRTTKQKINKGIENLNKTIDHIILMGTYKTFHPTKQKIHTSQVHMKISIG